MTDGCPPFDPKGINTQLIVIEYLRFRLAEVKYSLAFPLTTSFANTTEQWRAVICKLQYEAFQKEHQCFEGLKDLIERRHGNVSQVDVTEGDFKGVLVDILGTGGFAWEHVLGVFAYSGLLSVRLTSKGKSYQVDEIAQWTSEVINDRINPWLMRKPAGWCDLLNYTGRSSELINDEEDIICPSTTTPYIVLGGLVAVSAIAIGASKMMK